jgi:hypothetical protein
MTRPQIVLNVREGVVQEVFSSIPDLHVIVVDWDTTGFDTPARVELSLDGCPCSASVAEMTPVPLEELAGSDVERAIDAACEQEVLLE